MRGYGKVHCAVWESPTFRALTDDGRMLALYLMTCPHSTMAGVFRLPDGYVAEDVGWSPDRIRAAFGDLAQHGFAKRCSVTRWVWVVKHLEWNPLENPNQRKAAAKVARGVPDGCGWWPEFLGACGRLLGLDGDGPPIEGGEGGGPAPAPSKPPAAGPAAADAPAPQEPAQPAEGVAVVVAGPLPRGVPVHSYPQAEPFRKGFETVSERFPKAVANQEQNRTEQNSQTEDYTQLAPPVDNSVCVDNFGRPTPYGETWALLHRLGVTGASPGDPVFRVVVDNGVSHDEWRAAVDIAARCQRRDVQYVVGVVRRRRAQARELGAGLGAAPPPVAAVTVPSAETAAQYAARTAAERQAARQSPEQAARSSALAAQALAECRRRLAAARTRVLA